MPPFPSRARISSCGNKRATSSMLGGWKGGNSGCVPVSGVAPCLSRHAGQSPSNAEVGSAAPHCGHFLSMFSFASDAFIYLPQKQIPENVTEIMDYRTELLACYHPGFGLFVRLTG